MQNLVSEEDKKFIQSISEKIMERELKKREIEDLEDRLIKWEVEGREIREVLEVFNKLVEQRGRDRVEQIIGVINHGLEEVFDDRELELKYRLKELRGQKAYEFYLEDNGIEVEVLDGSGGGVINVVSLLFRLLLLVISSKRKFIVLDEPIVNLSEDYRYRLLTFIKKLTVTYNIQLIIVSHWKEVEEISDKVYSIEHDGKESRMIVKK